MIFGLFDKDKNKKGANLSIEDEAYVIGGTNIRYQPDLIESMKSEHRTLLDLYTKTLQASETGDFKNVATLLESFRRELEDHLLKENVHLYIYLVHSLEGDAMNSQLIANFRKEMNNIATTALKFLAKYETIAKDTNLHEGFTAELITIGKVLGDRIKREEETLYTLYMPPG